MCVVCHETVRVPVRLMCFPCVKPARGPSCNSITRVCRMCARRYLELDKPVSERSREPKRCLTCSATVYTMTLDEDCAVELDYWMIRNDPFSGYGCPHVEKGCAFTGTQQDLETHLHGFCPFRTVQCELCRTAYTSEHEEQHHAECPFRVICGLCEAAVVRHDLEHHMNLEHEHSKCEQCGAWIDQRVWQRHVTTQCPERRLPCPVCAVEVRVVEWTSHLANEEASLASEMGTCLAKLTQCTRTLQKIAQAKFTVLKDLGAQARDNQANV